MKKPLWTPSAERVQKSAMCRFMAFVNERHGTSIDCYSDLHAWSVADIRSFWRELWEFAPVLSSRNFDEVADDPARMPGARWFGGAQLNFAENLLRYRDERAALLFQSESGVLQRISYRELYRRVARLAHALKESGVTAGDRIAGFMPNLPETVIAMLASVSIGAIWTSCSPDFGLQGVMDRFGQINPKVLFSCDGYLYGGKRYPLRHKLQGMVARLPSLEHVVLVTYLGEDFGTPSLPQAVPIEEFTARFHDEEIEFVQLPADHPLYIMYSSGTTGAPKCMVQGAAGILVQHLKELMLHTDLTRDDTILYLTTCGWMMWNWLVSALATGATIVLYDGNPLYPDPGALWRLAQDQGLTVFGTSARYLTALEQAGVRPGAQYHLGSLRTLLSTGSPLSAEGFRYVYRAIKEDLQLASISGGTDLNGCFALGDPTGPVYPGELQCRGLGMAVQVYDASGVAVVGEPGELVCTAPFPSMPLYFWNDPDGSKYHRAYFEKFPGAWTHGDWCTLTETGGLIIHGRSDATLNPGGVRIGSAELYRVVETIPEVADSIAVGQRWQGDERIILFIKLAAGVSCSEELKERISAEIREKLSPRHVPAKIIPVEEIPYTINMKKVELAVRNVIHGEPVANREALANPEDIELYRDLPELRE